MNDKQQLAAMGEHLAEQQPMCMAKRIEELDGQVRVMGGALNELREFAAANVWDDDERGALLASIDAALCGQAPAIAEPKKPRITGVDGLDAEFSVKFPDGLDGEPKIHFQSLCFDGDGIGYGQHICAMLAAANWLIDKAEWYRKGSAIIYQPRAMFFIAPSPDTTK